MSGEHMHEATPESLASEPWQAPELRHDGDESIETTAGVGGGSSLGSCHGTHVQHGRCACGARRLICRPGPHATIHWIDDVDHRLDHAHVYSTDGHTCDVCHFVGYGPQSPDQDLCDVGACAECDAFRAAP